ncbi:GNAT family N-acetyltransferase [Arsenicicoccus piscis]|uniref:GNAT family acetyltransferase n=1 Tax=Arsenicicoccus piscis TaxID=673954 RepID=A0ABQ6HT10_9MICO|nr:GNAT family N-acetyltransferase [Arsenicicoccus piscis]MCH8626244.1 GNAT family N-acetyltransferase [Arsenicicoccus piscis]GMA20834.1 GNAT family acetyltransferase [Arsenicicoccus piscis]
MTATARPVLTTERVELRPMTSEHLELLVPLDADREVMRYLRPWPRTRAEVEEFWGPRCADQAADAVGLGYWVGFDRADGDFLGWWDLSPAAPVVAPVLAAELGYRLHRRHWGRGLATEGAEALLAHGFDTEIGAALGSVWAETMAINLGSRAVMAKLGLRHVRTDLRERAHPMPGADEGDVVYEITREEWLARTR